MSEENDNSEMKRKNKSLWFEWKKCHNMVTEDRYDNHWPHQMKVSDERMGLCVCVCVGGGGDTEMAGKTAMLGRVIYLFIAMAIEAQVKLTILAYTILPAFWDYVNINNRNNTL